MTEQYNDVNNNQIQEDQGPTMGVFKRIIGVITSPGKTFADIGREPKIAKAIIIILGLILIAYAATIPATIDYMQKNLGNITGVNGAATPPAAALAAGSIIGALIVVPISWLIVSAFYKVAFIITGEDAGFDRVFAVNLYAQVPIVLGLLVKAIIFIIKPTTSITAVQTSLALLLPKGNITSPLYNFLSTFDLFYIWTLILVAIGFVSAFKVSKKKAYTIVSILFGLKILFAVVPTFFVSKFLPGGNTTVK